MDQWFWLAAIIVGLISCFYGYPLFRILLIVAGLIYGYMIGQILAPASHPVLSLALGIILAVVLAVFAYPLWSIGVALVGAALGLRTHPRQLKRVGWSMVGANLVTLGLLVAT